MNYIEEVKKAVDAALEQRAAIGKSLDELNARYDAQRIGGADYAEQKAQLAARQEESRLSAAAEIMRLEKEHAADVDRAFSTVDAAQLDPDAQLLELKNFKPTPEQFAALAEKHRENRLMSQILAEYQSQHPDLNGVYIPSAEGKKQRFSDYAAAARQTVANPDSLQAAFFLDGKYTPQDE